MNVFLETLSQQVANGRPIALILDNAGWHIAKDLRIPDNITWIPLPPYAPELNAVEQIWEWLRNHCFSNQCYDDYEHIVDKTHRAWNTISAKPDLIKSIIQRDWVNIP